MRLEQLSQIIEIAKTGSFSEAARNLYITQPALSRSVKQLEEELGYEIFERKSGGVVLSPEGMTILERARTIELECQRMTDNLRVASPAPRKVFRSAALFCRTTSMLPDAIVRHDGEAVYLQYYNSTDLDEIIGLISSLRVDLATICTLSPYIRETKLRLKNLGIEYHKVSESALYAAVGPQNPMHEDRSEVTVDDLCKHTIISYGDHRMDTMCNFAVELGVADRSKGMILTNNPKIFYQSIHETSAVGLVAVPPESFARQCEYDDIKLIPISDTDLRAEYAWIKLDRVILDGIALEELKKKTGVY